MISDEVEKEGSIRFFKNKTCGKIESAFKNGF